MGKHAKFFLFGLLLPGVSNLTLQLTSLGGKAGRTWCARGGLPTIAFALSAVAAMAPILDTSEDGAAGSAQRLAVILTVLACVLFVFELLLIQVGFGTSGPVSGDSSAAWAMLSFLAPVISWPWAIVRLGVQPHRCTVAFWTPNLIVGTGLLATGMTFVMGDYAPTLGVVFLFVGCGLAIPPAAMLTIVFVRSRRGPKTNFEILDQDGRILDHDRQLMPLDP
jgi:hypothetical protein